MNQEPFLGFAFTEDAGGRVAFRNPAQVIEANDLGEVRPALGRVQEALNQGFYAAGYIGYEAAPAFDPAMKVRPGSRMPLLWFGIYEKPEDWNSPQLEEDALFELGVWESAESRERYTASIGRIKEAIAQGATYQVNHTLRLRTSFRGSGEGYYRQLARAQKAEYGAYLRFGGYEVLSVSPELFFRVEEGRLTTRPMKGTIRRGRYPDEDVRQRERLTASVKDRAENLMITDLLRNDLGRIAETGSVEVPELFRVEAYPTVYQMTSTVTCRLREGIGLEELFAALFPCGSVTGAPKISTMELIAELEEEPREIYCGAIGYASPYGKELAFNVPIRTVWIDKEAETAEYSVGGGVTWDSSADGEYEEALAKAAVLSHPVEPFHLLESLLLTDGRYWLMERHLDRLRASAAYFGFPYPEERLIANLDRMAAEHGEGAYKIRLLLAEDGLVEGDAAPIVPPSDERPRIGLAAERVDSADPFLYHKTTQRDRYARIFATGNGAYDMLLTNERGELTEFTRGNLVLEQGGFKWTPPIEAGLLAGTFRDELLARGEVNEKTLTPDDLKRADRIWFINSVRGWVEVVLPGV
ncbi:aminodeoxychorismate synthase component I [Gorillibacterium timonense]|uniref:aminodeoxychorismate synthase component I n=1 Tax=Gorillibacterium timonense TaxID=1689269 RepID=UPI00071C2ABF|nr:aminodeoxychorismate synthase component I [Gorillibacterium timonense]